MRFLEQLKMIEIVDRNLKSDDFQKTTKMYLDLFGSYDDSYPNDHMTNQSETLSYSSWMPTEVIPATKLHVALFA